MNPALAGSPYRARRGWLRPGTVIPLSVVAAILLFAGLGDLLTPYAHDQSNLLARNRPPVFLGGGWDYPLGTDRLGRDVVARLVLATRVTVLVAVVGTLIGAILGTTLGLIAAHRRGVTEDAIMMAVDIQASLPFIIIALAVLAFFGNSLLLFLMLMGIYGWETYARLTRAAALSVRGQPYSLSALALGVGTTGLFVRHILPNIAHVLIVQFTLNFPQTILLETGLSFLGLGIQSPLTSLGQMLGEGRDSLISAWWVAVIPGTLIFLTTLSLSLLGDRLRDHLDPTLRGRR